jgi:hypothetical protein
MVGALLLPGPMGEGPARFDNPFGLPGVAGTVATVATFTGVVLHWASLPAAAVCVVLRFRASRGVERQQMRWVATGAAGAVAGLLLTLPGGWGLLPQATTFVIYPALLCPPVSVAVVVLRYRLWDLDRLVSRTVTYALVTGLLVVPYLLILPAVTGLAGDAGSLAVAAATLAAAAAFSPLRRRVQDLVDRRASTAAATTPPAPWRGSRPGCASRSTWTRSRPSCWRWSTRPYSRPGRRCGYARRSPRGRRGSTATTGQHGSHLSKARSRDFASQVIRFETAADL